MPSIPATLHSLLLRLPIFVELSPVYKGTNVPTNVRARNRALIGWTMAIFDADQILSPALGSGKAVSLVLAYAPRAESALCSPELEPRGPDSD